MAYKLFTAGEEALAVDVNNYWMAQTVSRFPSAANRATNLVAPALNQVTMTDDRPGLIQYWNGAAWVDLNRDPVLHQYGSTVGTTNGFGWLTIPLPAAFADVTYRAVTINGDVDSAGGVYSFWTGVLGGGKFVNSFAVGANWVSGGVAVPVANTNIRVDWIALGVRP